MNRSILIVICDFFLLSLLTWSTPDMNKVAQANPPLVMAADAATNQATGRQDLSDVMRLALSEERRIHDTLLDELGRTRESVTNRDQQIRDFQSQLQTSAQQAANLRAQETNLLAEETNLLSEVAAAQSRIAALNQQLRASQQESALSNEQRAAMEAEARKQLERAGALERQLAGLQESNQVILADRVELGTRLQISEAERKSVLANMTQLQGEVESQHQINSKLADSVKTLAAKNAEFTALTQEIRETHPMAPNEVFEQLTTNRLQASFYGLKKGFLFTADTSKYTQCQIVLATIDDTNTFAICHVQDTPLTLWNPGTQWKDLSGTLSHGATVFTIDSISFCAPDPRVILIPVTAAQVRALGCKVYRLSHDPFKFQDAVVAGTQENYYGEVRFQMDMDNPDYVKMDRSSIRGLFGKFNPSSGDLVLSKAGELVGLMANDNYCLLMRSFDPGLSLKFGSAGNSQTTGQTLSTLYAVVAQLPFKLQ